MTLSDRFLALGIVTDDLTEDSMDKVRDRIVALEAFSHRRPRLDEIRGIVADVRLEQRAGAGTDLHPLEVDQESEPAPAPIIDCESCVPVRHWMASGGVGAFHARECPDRPDSLIRALSHPVGTARPQVRERPKRGARIYRFRHPDTCRCGNCNGADLMRGER